jgi:WD40 repeat protein
MRRLILLVLSFSFFTLTARSWSQQPCQPPTLRFSSQQPNIFTEEQESDLGDAMADHLQRDFGVIEDASITGQLNQIGERIIRHLPTTKFRIRFFLVDLPDATAFVLPGGRVYVSRKLVAMTRTEDELAGVISHELGHLIARHSSIRMTRMMREVLGLASVKDRQDIFEKYNQIVENAARKPKAFEREDQHADRNQMEADLVGMFAMAASGYDPQSFTTFYDRLAETKGKTGNFFTDLFGTTTAESRRLREMIKGVASLPPSCIEARKAAPLEEFQKWQTLVVNFAGAGRKEALHSVRSKVALNPPLRSQITHLRFSPDGRHLLAQDDSGINVMSREPLRLLFRIDAPEARYAQFTPDSQHIAFSTHDLRVEIWNVAEQRLKSAHELFVRKGCVQTLLSPDSKTMACLDTDLDLNLFNVTSGEVIFQKKKFHIPNVLNILFTRLLSVLSEGQIGDIEPDWVNMGFSPDSRYFAAGGRTAFVNSMGGFSKEINALAFDLTSRQQVSLRGPTKMLLSGGFTFIGPDRLVGVDISDTKNSAIISFPSGQVLDKIPLGGGKLSASVQGNYLLIRPIVDYAVGVMDLSTRKIFQASRQSAFDLYDNVFVSERVNGELALYSVEKNEVVAKIDLPPSPLGRLRATALSNDFKWLAVSERMRGGVWNLSKGERIFHVRGFRGGHFAEDGSLYADFPRLDDVERMVAKLDLASRKIFVGNELKETNISQHGGYMVVIKPAKEDGFFSSDVILEVRDSRSFRSLWSKPFLKEAPAVWMNGPEGTMVLSWVVSSNAAKNEIKSDPALAGRLAVMKEKEGDYLLHVLDAKTGNMLGRLLIETGKGSFRIADVMAAGDWVVISDTQNRVLIYSLSTGEQKGRVFGVRPSISAASNLLCVENERGQLSIHDLKSMEKRDQFVFQNPISLAQFSRDGKSLFVLTADQTAYVLDVDE